MNEIDDSIVSSGIIEKKDGGTYTANIERRLSIMRIPVWILSREKAGKA